MTIVLDENLPHPLKTALSGFTVVTVQELGLAGTKNGELLAILESKAQVFLTADKNLRYQQNLTGRRLAVVELETNRWPILQRRLSEIEAALRQVEPSEYLQVSLR